MAKMVTCPTCSATVADVPEHLKHINDRRERYGATWELATVTTYRPTDIDVETEPLIAYTPAVYSD